MKKSGYIIIEGNIGAGKSTFAQALVESFKSHGLYAEDLPEPDEKTNPFLADYYADSKATAYKMQAYLLGKRYTATQYAQWGAQYGKGWYIMDRSYFGDLCFANVQRINGFFTDEEFKSYINLHHNMQTQIHFPTAAIFLETSPEHCKERINKRKTEKAGRECESDISIEYLSELDQEIRKLGRFMQGKCDTRYIDWDTPRTEEEIQQKAGQVVKQLIKDDEPSRDDTYSPWGSVGDQLFDIQSSNLKGLAERENNA